MAMELKGGILYSNGQPYTGSYGGKTYKAGLESTEAPPMATWIVTALQTIPELQSLFAKVKNSDGSFKYDANTIATMINDTEWYRLNGPTVAQKLIDRGLITSAHKDLTSSDVAAGNYVEDIAEVIRNAIINWDTVVNDRGGR
jgi:hypothetical protein